MQYKWESQIANRNQPNQTSRNPPLSPVRLDQIVAQPWEIATRCVMTSSQCVPNCHQAGNVICQKFPSPTLPLGSCYPQKKQSLRHSTPLQQNGSFIITMMCHVPFLHVLFLQLERIIMLEHWRRIRPVDQWKQFARRCVVGWQSFPDTDEWTSTHFGSNVLGFS